jgi:hypothetical protein
MKFAKLLAVLAALTFTIAVPAMADDSLDAARPGHGGPGHGGPGGPGHGGPGHGGPGHGGPGWGGPGHGGPGWGGPGHGGPGWGGPGWGPGRGMVCYAQNRRGQTFQAFGRGNPQWIQRAALQECAQNSWGGFRSCRALGCR